MIQKNSLSISQIAKSFRFAARRGASSASRSSGQPDPPPGAGPEAGSGRQGCGTAGSCRRAWLRPQGSELALLGSWIATLYRFAPLMASGLKVEKKPNTWEGLWSGI